MHFFHQKAFTVSHVVDLYAQASLQLNLVWYMWLFFCFTVFSPYNLTEVVPEIHVCVFFFIRRRNRSISDVTCIALSAAGYTPV